MIIYHFGQIDGSKEYIVLEDDHISEEEINDHKKHGFNLIQVVDGSDDTGSLPGDRPLVKE